MIKWQVYVTWATTYMYLHSTYLCIKQFKWVLGWKKVHVNIQNKFILFRNYVQEKWWSRHYARWVCAKLATFLILKITSNFTIIILRIPFFWVFTDCSLSNWFTQINAFIDFHQSRFESKYNKFQVFAVFKWFLICIKQFFYEICLRACDPERKHDISQARRAICIITSQSTCTPSKVR